MERQKKREILQVLLHSPDGAGARARAKSIQSQEPAVGPGSPTQRGAQAPAAFCCFLRCTKRELAGECSSRESTTAHTGCQHLRQQFYLQCLNTNSILEFSTNLQVSGGVLFSYSSKHAFRMWSKIKLSLHHLSWPKCQRPVTFLPGSQTSEQQG